MKKLVKGFVILFLASLMFNVNAEVKCDAGKPGDTVNCTIKNGGSIGTIKRITVDEGLTFVSCDVCDDTQYTIEENKTANFKFKISENIKETKKLTATFGGETATIDVLAENKTEVPEENENEKVYTVTLIPGKGANKTLSCPVNSLNTTCNVTLESLDDENFTGWGKEKNCTEGATGSVKVNKNITYYACYKKDSATTTTQSAEVNKDLNLKSLVIKNGDEKLDINFSIRIFTYDITVPTETTNLTVEAVASDGIEVEVSGQDNLTNEENKIIITLTDKSGKKNEYTINVKKSDKVQLPKLSSLVIGGYNINFSPDNFVYTLEIDSKISSLNIDAQVEDDLEKEVIGNENLKNGSQIKIIVTNPLNDTSSTYIINIVKGINSLYIYLAIGGIVLVILIILLIIVVKKGKKGSSNSKNNNTKSTKKIPNNAKKVNNKANIPEVKPVIPSAPSIVTNNTKSVDKKEDIEILDI